jgi:hypothetical protein
MRRIVEFRKNEKTNVAPMTAAARRLQSLASKRRRGASGVPLSRADLYR